jgi:hypothetical protein
MKLHAMKTYGEMEVQFHAFLISALDKYEWSVQAPTALFLEKLPPPPRYPLHRRLGGPQSRSGRYGEEENLCPCGGNEPRSCSS